MKKLFYLFLVLPLFFVACSDDDDDNYDGKIDPQENIFKNGLIKQIDDTKFTYNSKGQLEKAVDDYTTVTFAYDKKFTKATSSADVTMTVKESGSEPADVYLMYLGSNGFVKTIKREVSYTEDNGEKMTEVNDIYASYNSDDQLSGISFSYIYKNAVGKEVDRERYVYELYYKDGNLSKVISKDLTEGEESENETTFAYTSEDQKDGVANVSGLMLWDALFDVDLDDIEYAYYAGILGKSTSKLPLTSENIRKYMAEDENGKPVEGSHEENYTYEWTLNDKKMPTEMKSTRNGSSYSDTYTFVW